MIIREVSNKKSGRHQQLEKENSKIDQTSKKIKSKKERLSQFEIEIEW